ncbi:hypothetical protein FDP41_000333 [Naegleria fowleri]|uniref:Small ribosomal subunit protein mS41 n=1 Tax=Naegleria fowleri TaxID=5763 RepID=A0A6A5CD03_NAEFO|nr:uncharacterized protein FDP41_000333 [Naegleria fowleri]KAF0984434.1 hypothetical protein FDP41_000333 [Naegleria fowleri]CAG4708528.1 unnamed protein product [Naegleria fowleri]
MQSRSSSLYHHGKKLFLLSSSPVLSSNVILGNNMVHSRNSLAAIKQNEYKLLLLNNHQQQQHRFYADEAAEEEEDEETKLRRQLENLPKPKIDPLLIPRRRRGITMESFLKNIGKGCEEHIDKFKSWEDLFTSKSLKLKAKEIPVAQRRWILKWLERYRKGEVPGFPQTYLK